jgi:hypothetical protein
MDEYLVPNSSFLRLWNEYHTHNSLVVAFDFDNTVYDFHKKGHQYTDVISLLRELKEIGCYLICFTANSNKSFVVNYLIDNKIPFHALNENPPFFKCEERKIYFNVLLDDRAGLLQAYTELNLLITMLNKQNEN